MYNERVARPDSGSASCLSCAVRSFSICDAVDEGELGKFGKLAKSLHFKSKRHLFVEGESSDAAYNVLHGTIRLYKLLPDGRRQIVGFAASGDFIGLTSDVSYGFTADAIDAVIVCRFSKEKLSRFIETKPHMLQRLNDFSRRELALAHDHMVSLGRRSAEGKVAAFIIGWRNRFHKVGRAAGVIYLPMSRPDIADYLGLTVETVSRTLTKLERDGVILLIPRGIRLMDTRRVEALAAA